MQKLKKRVFEIVEQGV